MKYRRFGKFDFMVSVLGFGAMRLPVIGGNHSNVNEPLAIEMIRYAIDHGVNYIDTAYSYHNGKSEVIVGKALKDGYREKVKLATKMPVWLVNSQDDMEKYLNEQLARLQTDHVDFYLLHAMESERWQKMKKLNVFKWSERKITEGKIKGLGFSFHDEFEVFKEIVDGYDGWAMCQILYNYMAQDRQAGNRGLKYAASKGLPVVVMEPIGGGTLAVNPPKEVKALWDKAKTKRSLAEWALLWVWNNPEVSVALSGMSTMQQVIENLKIANCSKPGVLKDEELKLIEMVRKKYLEHGFIGCTGCGYCLPCPNGVNIPDILALYNQYYTKTGDKNAEQETLNKYMKIVSKESGAKNCKKCARCEELCPQRLPIRELLRDATSIFEREW
ncbi:MAG: aldo/keto reductase [Candidatus Jordarchaeaceae archaeon]